MELGRKCFFQAIRKYLPGARKSCEVLKRPSIFAGHRYHQPFKFLGLVKLAMLSSMVYLANSYSEVVKQNVKCYAHEHKKDVTHISTKDRFFKACKDGDLSALKSTLAEGQDVNERHKYGWTGLMVAAVNGHQRVVEHLLEVGANPNLQDKYDPFHQPKSKSKFTFPYRDIWDTRHQEFSLYLDDVQPFIGWTALHYAVKMNYTDMIALFYSYGVDGSVANDDGDTAVKLASVSGQELILKHESLQRKKRCDEVFQSVKLLDVLYSNLVGQQLAIEEVCDAVRRLQTGWNDDTRPMVLLFVGATGLGKTEMAKLLAKYLRGDAKHSFLHINLSEYNTEHEAAKFIGAPPGYVGYGSTGEGQLLSVLKQNPEAVVLFDEADKAHPDVLATLLQLFDEGILTSGSGNTVECSKALFILTANLAVSEIQRFGEELRRKYPSSIATCRAREGFVREFKEALLHGPLKDAFKRDELLGRINEVALFLPFTPEQREQVVDKQLCELRKMAASRHGITLTWHQSVLQTLGELFNEQYGVRHVRHQIDRLIVTRLAKALESGLYKPGDFLHLEVCDKLGAINPSDKVRLIQVYKLSPLGEKEHLDVKFADIGEIFEMRRC